MGTMLSNKIGLAGELRVMSELLLRGHNPAKSYLEEGADIILGNRLRLEVKSGHRTVFRYRKQLTRSYYLFTLRSGKRKQAVDCDFIVLWCIDDDCFFIIPRAEITGQAVPICRTTDNSRSGYYQYKNRWDLLEVNDEC